MHIYIYINARIEIHIFAYAAVCAHMSPCMAVSFCQHGGALQEAPESWNTDLGRFTLVVLLLEKPWAWVIVILPLYGFYCSDCLRFRGP